MHGDRPGCVQPSLAPVDVDFSQWRQEIISRYIYPVSTQQDFQNNHFQVVATAQQARQSRKAVL